MLDNIKRFSIQRRGRIFVISAPSGTGKTSIINAILKTDIDIVLSVSYTTRDKRPSEIHGKDYIFTTVEKFQKLISEEFFIEYSNIFGNFYGIPKLDAHDILSDGRNVVFVVDYNGFKAIRKSFPHDIVGIYILPPSTSELVTRITKRSEDSNISNRLSDFNEQLQVINQYDYLVINDDFEVAIQDVSSILNAEKLSTKALNLSY